jgi:hypothetical protein
MNVFVVPWEIAYERVRTLTSEGWRLVSVIRQGSLATITVRPS